MCTRPVAKEASGSDAPAVETPGAKASVASTQQSGSSGSGGGAGPRPGVGSPIGWSGLGLATLTGMGLLAFYQYEKQRRMGELFNNRTQQAVAGKAALGGPFKLVNQDGKSVTEESLKGQFSLLYFGFTHCPDICPDELIKISEATDLIHKRTAEARFRPVFISIDPERDDVEQVKSYVEDFHPSLW
eukprot:scaffold655_cov379-Prasinococcus_capsulatus_cf.AAC.32